MQVRVGASSPMGDEAVSAARGSTYPTRVVWTEPWPGGGWLQRAAAVAEPAASHRGDLLPGVCPFPLLCFGARTPDFSLLVKQFFLTEGMEVAQESYVSLLGAWGALRRSLRCWDHPVVLPVRLGTGQA